MVPGSTLRYGSNFCSVTLRPRFSSKVPREAAVSPLPRELTTPPVTKIYFIDSTAIAVPPAPRLQVCPLRCCHSLPALRRFRFRSPAPGVAPASQPTREPTPEISPTEAMPHADIHKSQGASEMEMPLSAPQAGLERLRAHTESYAVKNIRRDRHN